jgi:arabinoxylan arabinofuranohydrolase
MHKHGGRYYFSYSADFSSGHGAALEYLIGSSPMSGFEYQGKLLQNANINNGNNNHGSIIEFGGKNYVFYHNRKLEQELRVDKVNNRSVAIQELSYAADGKIPTLSMSTDDYTVSQLKCLDGFAEIEAERLAEEQGIEVEGRAGETVRVARIEDGDWVAYSQVNFRAGAKSLVAKVASAAGGGKFDVVIDGCIGGKSGTSIGTCEVKSTGGASTFAALACPLTQTSGAHDVCLKFSGSPKFELDSFHLE